MASVAAKEIETMTQALHRNQLSSQQTTQSISDSQSDIDMTNLL